ncbi:Alpha/Beta hydrolase protein [Tricladium varicosporioides]|nr:Alpha/Beta hydrolase protein [Hymenoscyphus varicosporioides]
MIGFSIPSNIAKAQHSSSPSSSPLDLQTNISLPLFAELEELSRIVDISYCVGTTGISHPFQCASRCDQFPTFELVDTFNTGPLMSDSCGYIAVDHDTKKVGTGRIIVAFRGTYSLANTIVDLSTVPQEYIPYPEDPQNEKPKDPEGERKGRRRFRDWLPGHWKRLTTEDVPCHGTCSTPEKIKCDNCTNTRPFVVPHLKNLRERYPSYRLDLVGHSLGGAVAALAGLEFQGLDWKPYITTFGEPKVGNPGLRNFIDETFSLPSEHLVKSAAALHSGRYRRVTHVDDPVPLLPLQEWGYRSHAGEIYISKSELQPNLADLRLCYGDEDLHCMAGAEADASWLQSAMDLKILEDTEIVINDGDAAEILSKRWGIPIPARYKIWQLFFAHRDYFWRLGLCVPGGDPLDWGRGRYDFGDDGKEEL